MVLFHIYSQHLLALNKAFLKCVLEVSQLHIIPHFKAVTNWSSGQFYVGTEIVFSP